MKFTLTWLKEYLDTKATASEICDKLDQIGLEVEEVIDNGKALKDFKCVCVEDVENHPDSDHLHVCKVRNVNGELLQIVCGAPNVKKGMNLPDAFVEYLGLNHLAWITRVEYQGKDYLQEAIDNALDSGNMKNIPTLGFSHELVKTIGAIPTSYLNYYYHKDKMVEKCLKAEKCRGEICQEIEEELLKIYENSEQHTKPELLSKRGGARYSEVAINLIDAIYNDRQNIQVVNILNKGAIPWMADDDAVEMCAIIGKDGAKPIPTTYRNKNIEELIHTMKEYEKHAVKAAMTGSVEEAMHALMVNPLVFDYDKAYNCFFDLLEAHKEYLPLFKDAKKEEE